ncbi:MAG: ATP-binding protein, partial [Lachnospiraceae bacterium]|nr:ATP-binding protein [Lachnospiraceae bacterium]
MATVGKNILDNLTTGMYSDSKVIYREYIQNACDQIDLAISMGILTANEGSVDIFIDTKKRYI